MAKRMLDGKPGSQASCLKGDVLSGFRCRVTSCNSMLSHVSSLIVIRQCGLQAFCQGFSAAAYLKRPPVRGHILGELLHCLAHFGVRRRPRGAGVWSRQLDRRSDAQGRAGAHAT